MSRVLNREDKLVIASHNQGKVSEIADLLRPLAIDIIGALELGLDEPEETGQTFIENAVLKAELAAKAAQLPALADDSGLVVNALGGAPGIYSARWAGPEKDFDYAMRRVSEALLLGEIQTGAVHLSVHWRWLGLMVIQRVLKDGSMATSPGHPEGRMALDMMRFSRQLATSRHLAK